MPDVWKAISFCLSSLFSRSCSWACEQWRGLSTKCSQPTFQVGGTDLFLMRLLRKCSFLALRLWFALVIMTTNRIGLSAFCPQSCLAGSGSGGRKWLTFRGRKSHESWNYRMDISWTGLFVYLYFYLGIWNQLFSSEFKTTDLHWKIQL